MPIVFVLKYGPETEWSIAERPDVTFTVFDVSYETLETPNALEEAEGAIPEGWRPMVQVSVVNGALVISQDVKTGT